MNSCCVVDHHCTHPANRERGVGGPLRTKCYRCGDFVCKRCSEVGTDRFANKPRTRRCARCIQEDNK